MDIEWLCKYLRVLRKILGYSLQVHEPQVACMLVSVNVPCMQKLLNAPEKTYK